MGSSTWTLTTPSGAGGGGMLRLLHLTDRTSRLLHVTRLETVFEIFEDEATALQSFVS